MGTTSTLARSGWTQWTPGEARKALTRWKKSGQPMATFARRLGVSSQRLRWWQSRLGEWNAAAEPAAARLVPVVVTSVAAAAPVVVHVPGGVSIEVSDAAAVPAEWVAAVARGLARG